MGGQDLVGNELEYRAIGEITYSGDAQVIATSVDKKISFYCRFSSSKRTYNCHVRCKLVA